MGLLDPGVEGLDRRDRLGVLAEVEREALAEPGAVGRRSAAGSRDVVRVVDRASREEHLRVIVLLDHGLVERREDLPVTVGHQDHLDALVLHVDDVGGEVGLDRRHLTHVGEVVADVLHRSLLAVPLSDSRVGVRDEVRHALDRLWVLALEDRVGGQRCSLSERLGADGVGKRVRPRVERHRDVGHRWVLGQHVARVVVEQREAAHHREVLAQG